MKGRGTALRSRADLGAREGNMGPGAPALVSPISLCPRCSCFPGSRICLESQGQGVESEGGWTEADGVVDGGTTGQRLCCGGDTTPWPSPLSLQESHGQGWGHRPQGAMLQ